MLGLEAFQKGHCGIRLFLDFNVIAGHADEGLGGETGFGCSQEQLVPGLEGLGVGVGVIGPLATSVELLGEIRVLRLERPDRDHRQGENQCESARAPEEPGHGSLERNKFIIAHGIGMQSL